MGHVLVSFFDIVRVAIFACLCGLYWRLLLLHCLSTDFFLSLYHFGLSWGRAWAVVTSASTVSCIGCVGRGTTSHGHKVCWSPLSWSPLCWLSLVGRLPVVEVRSWWWWWLKGGLSVFFFVCPHLTRARDAVGEMCARRLCTTRVGSVKLDCFL